MGAGIATSLRCRPPLAAIAPMTGSYNAAEDPARIFARKAGLLQENQSLQSLRLPFRVLMLTLPLPLPSVKSRS